MPSSVVETREPSRIARFLGAASLASLVLAGLAGLPMRLNLTRPLSVISPDAYNIAYAIHGASGRLAVLLLIITLVVASPNRFVRGLRVLLVAAMVSVAVGLRDRLVPISFFMALTAQCGWLFELDEDEDAIVAPALVVGVASATLWAAFSEVGSLGQMFAVLGDLVTSIALLGIGVARTIRRWLGTGVDKVLRGASFLGFAAVVLSSVLILSLGPDLEIVHDTLVPVGSFVLASLSLGCSVAHETGFGRSPRSPRRMRFVACALALALGCAGAFALMFEWIGVRGVPRGYYDHLGRFDTDFTWAAVFAFATAPFAVVVAVDAVLVALRPTRVEAPRVDATIFG